MTIPIIVDALQLLRVGGSWGQFGGADGSPVVTFVQTHASPTADGTAPSELADLLVPVREVFDLEKLTFDQILQRDLDDHRVASELIPYLLRRPNVPKFFPPILAVVVPFKSNEVADHYEASIDAPPEAAGPGIERRRAIFGTTFEFSRFYDTTRSAYVKAQAEVGLNRHSARLMVVDGQHRAMALLAIQRTLTNSWEKTRGSAYKHFYADLGLDRIDPALLAQVELPVCLCFFPTLVAGANKPSLSDVCRRIFLDVNRTARKPSESRNILMDDYDLRAVFTRAVFTLAKDGGTSASPLRLRHVEYDNPTDRIQVRKGVAITNVRTVEAIIEWIFAREDEYFQNLGKSPQKGRFSLNNARMQRLLRLSEQLGATELEGWGVSAVKDIAIGSFPPQARDRLVSLFCEEWGRLLLGIFSDYAPFAQHIAAVETVYASSAAAQDEARLARQALFEGQGLYFTLEEYKESLAKRRADGDGSLPAADTLAELAWAHTQRWLDTVAQSRSAWLVGSINPQKEDIAKSNRVFDLLRTQAFQIGFAMAVAYLIEQVQPSHILDASRRWISAASRAWDFVGVRARLYDKSADGLAAVYPGQLSPSDWPFFRYTLFEQILFGGRDLLPESEIELLELAVARGRTQLITRVRRAVEADARRDGETLDPAESVKRARDRVRKALFRCLKVTEAEFLRTLQLAEGTTGGVSDETEEPDTGADGLANSDVETS